MKDPKLGGDLLKVQHDFFHKIRSAKLSEIIDMEAYRKFREHEIQPQKGRIRDGKPNSKKLHQRS